jgi:hypothetical protein
MGKGIKNNASRRSSWWRGGDCFDAIRNEMNLFS